MRWLGLAGRPSGWLPRLQLAKAAACIAEHEVHQNFLY